MMDRKVSDLTIRQNFSFAVYASWIGHNAVRAAGRALRVLDKELQIGLTAQRPSAPPLREPVSVRWVGCRCDE